MGRRYLALLVGGVALLSLPVPLSAATICPSGPATDCMVLSNASDSAITNYPLQFGRPFVQGELRNYPLVLANTKALATQADVKNRWPDGSVKFAIISVIIPAIPANAPVTLTFANQSSGNNTPLTPAQMLANDFDFDAAIAIASGSERRTASARAMLQDGAYTYWTSGPIATTILLADDSTNRAYDLGFDVHKSFRPRFYATFWPSTHQVQVRYVGENSNSTTLENLTYSLALRLGNTAPRTVYTQSNVQHSYLTRWTKVYWQGGTPSPQVTIDTNLAYLAATRYFPQYDTSSIVSQAAIAATYARWQKAKHTNINDSGLWVQGMGTTGARPDIGPVPEWAAMWLYTGDWRSRAVALGQADLAGAWPLQARESSTGLPMTLYDHPQIWFPDNNGSFSALALQSKPSAHSLGWAEDGAHQPDPYYTPYILTGDFFYLESLQMWAGMDSLRYCVGSPWCRGPAGIAGIQDQIRGNAWVFRNRANAAFITPDANITMKTALEKMTDEAIAVWEGKAGVMDSTLSSTKAYQWGANDAGYTSKDSPLHFFGCTGTGSCSLAEWQQNYWLVVLGMETERGFKTGPFFSWLAYQTNSRYADKGYNPYNLDAYYTKVRDASGKYYQSWAALQAGNAGMSAAKSSFATTQSYYPVLAAAATAYTASEPGGRVAWEFVDTNIRKPSHFSSYYNGAGDVSWNIIPRAVATATPAATLPTPAIPTTPRVPSTQGTSSAGYPGVTPIPGVASVAQSTGAPTTTPAALSGAGRLWLELIGAGIVSLLVIIAVLRRHGVY